MGLRAPPSAGGLPRFLIAARPMADPVVIPEGWLARGDAFVSGDGSQLAVFGGIPGERARVKIVGGKARQAFAKWIQPVGKAHPSRVKPPCDRFVPCGRCPVMHLNWAGQDQMRQDLVAEALRFAGLVTTVRPVVRGAEKEVQYTLDLAVGRSDQGRIRVGLPGRDGREVLAVPECLVVTPAIRNVMGASAYLLGELDLWPWDGKRGTVRGIRVLQAPNDGECLVIVGTAKPNPTLGEFAAQLASRHGGIAGVVMHIEEGGRDAFKVDEAGELPCMPLYGKLALDLSLAGLPFRVGPSDPFPVHPVMDARVAEAVVGALAPQPGDAVLDLAAGLGLRTRLLAAQSGWALGVDPREGVVRRARENATGGAAEFSTELDPKRFEGLRPLVAVDGGTRGLVPDQVESLLALQPRRVVVLGTNPRSFAKGVSALTRRGFSLRSVEPFDVAPNTPFVELVGLLDSTDPTPAARRAPRRKALRG